MPVVYLKSGGRGTSGDDERCWGSSLFTDNAERVRALYGQLMMVALAAVVLLSGFFIMSIGLRDVLIPSDGVFLGDSKPCSPPNWTVRCIAHDRYLDVFHLLPVYVGIVWVAVVLRISTPWFFTRV